MRTSASRRDSRKVLARSPSRGWIDFRTAHWLSLAIPGALLLGATGSQFIGGLVPCDMCMWQRWPHVAAVVLAIAAFFVRGARRPLVGMAALAIAISGGIGVYHAGVELGIFEGLTTCSTAGGTSIEDILAAPVVRCDGVQWSFLGVSMAGWNAIISLAGAALIATGLKRGRA